MAILVAVLALVALLGVGIGVYLDTIVADVSRGNVCASDRDECFVDERGRAVSYDGVNDEVVVSVGTETVTLSAPVNFEDPPRPGAPVVLQRWEGREVAWMIDLETGKRHGTSSFRGEAAKGLVICLVVLAVVCGTSYTWLRGY